MYGRLLLGAVIAISAPRLNAQTRLITRTAFEFGGLNDDPGTELIRIGAVMRTPKGQFLVANAKPLELRLYDSTGKVIRRIGRDGAGPGEYKSSISLKPWTGDSFLVYSSGTQRWSLFGFDGKMVREWKVDSLNPYPPAYALHSWAFMLISKAGSRGCPAAIVDKLPQPTPFKLRESVTDGAGRLWTHIDGAQWQIYSPTGQRLGIVDLPKDFAIVGFNGDMVIGTRKDEDAATRVTVIRVQLPVQSAAAVCPTKPPSGPVIDTLNRNMGMLRTAGEVWYAGHKSYPANLPSELVTLPQGIEAKIFEATDKGWAVMLTHKASKAKCFFSNNTPLVPSMYDFVIVCGD